LGVLAGLAEHVWSGVGYQDQELAARLLALDDPEVNAVLFERGAKWTRWAVVKQFRTAARMDWSGDQRGSTCTSPPALAVNASLASGRHGGAGPASGRFARGGDGGVRGRFDQGGVPQFDVAGTTSGGPWGAGSGSAAELAGGSGDRSGVG
jgi:hypothetical protein